MSGLLEAFTRSYVASQNAFRTHDLETTFADLPDDAVWEPIPEILDRHPAVGKPEILEMFRQLIQEWPDWATDVREITEPEPGLIRVHFRASGTGRISGALTKTDVHQEWDFRAQPLHVREYLAFQR